jgi:hypothetical protein
MLGARANPLRSRLGFELMNETASRALPGMSRLSLTIIALTFALEIAAFVLTVFTF